MTEFYFWGVVLLAIAPKVVTMAGLSFISPQQTAIMTNLSCNESDTRAHVLVPPDGGLNTHNLIFRSAPEGFLRRQTKIWCPTSR